MREPVTGPGRVFWLLQLGGWTAFVAALLLPWLGAFPVSTMLARKLPVAVIGLLTTVGLRWLYRFISRTGAPVAALGAAAIAGSCVGAWIWAGVVDRLGPWIDPWMVDHGALIRASLDRFPGTAYYAFVLAAWSALYIGLMHYRALEAERARTVRAEALADRARLHALRYQINPHFLFNTLNAISTLVVEHRADDAERMIARLGGFLRLTLDRPDADEIALIDELEFVRRYVEIEEVRFEERQLSVRIDAEPRALRARVPAMVLQPIVENALRHVGLRRQAGGRVVVDARCDGNLLRLSVTDNGPGLDSGGAVGNGIGLRNTGARLRHLYGDTQRLALTRAEGGGVCAVVELPYAVMDT